MFMALKRMSVLCTLAAAAIAGAGCANRCKTDGCHVISVIQSPPGMPNRDAVYLEPIRSVGCNTPCGQLAGETRNADNLSVLLQGTGVNLDGDAPKAGCCVASFDVLMAPTPGTPYVATWRGAWALAGAAGPTATIEFAVGSARVHATIKDGVLSGPGVTDDNGQILVQIPLTDLASLPTRTTAAGKQGHVLPFSVKICATRGSTDQSIRVEIDSVDIAPPITQ